MRLSITFKCGGIFTIHNIENHHNLFTSKKIKENIFLFLQHILNVIIVLAQFLPKLIMIQLTSTKPISSAQLEQRKQEQDRLGKRCRQIFNEIKSELIEKYDHWFIAINPETKHYLLNPKLDDLLTQVRQEYPDGELKLTIFRLSDTGICGQI